MSQMSEGYCEVYKKHTPTARKEHRCCACRETIRPGDRYVLLKTIFEGDVSVYKRCLRCEAIHAHLVHRTLIGGDGTWPDEELNCGHGYQEAWGEEPPEGIAGLAFMTADEAQRMLGGL